MSPFDVHGDEMPSFPPLDDAAVEALLAGRTNDAATGELGLLVTFAEHLRVAAGGAVPQPRPDLATLMARGLGAEGLSTEKGSRPATAASTVTGPAWPVAGRPKERKTTMSLTQLIAGLAAKVAGLGLAAKAALGAGMVAVGMTSAAAVGVLPDPVQHAVASVVNPVSPFNLSDGGGTAVETGADDDSTGTTTSTPSTALPGGDDDDDATGGETGVAANHGACVSEAAQTAPRGPGGVHGKAVSEAARSDCGKGSDDDSTTTTSTPGTTTTSIDDDEASSNTGPGSANPGSGKGNGQGGANGGPGNSGSSGGSRGSGGGRG